MALTFKVFSKVFSAINTEEAAYACPASKKATVTSFHISNADPTNAGTFRAGIADDGGALSQGEFKWYDVAIAAKEVKMYCPGWVLDQTDEIRGYVSDVDIVMSGTVIEEDR